MLTPLESFLLRIVPIIDGTQCSELAIQSELDLRLENGDEKPAVYRAFRQGIKKIGGGWVGIVSAPVGGEKPDGSFPFHIRTAWIGGDLKRTGVEEGDDDEFSIFSHSASGPFGFLSLFSSHDGAPAAVSASELRFPTATR